MGVSVKDTPMIFLDDTLEHQYQQYTANQQKSGKNQNTGFVAACARGLGGGQKACFA